jgi:hypothetical protein
MCDSSISARRGAWRLAGMIGSLEFCWDDAEGIALSIAEISLCHRSRMQYRAIQEGRLFDISCDFHQTAIDHVQGLRGGK